MHIMLAAPRAGMTRRRARLESRLESKAGRRSRWHRSPDIEDAQCAFDIRSLSALEFASRQGARRRPA
jgi:hypothetical protein